MRADWDITLDHSRKERLGFDEAVFCAAKTVDQIRRILDSVTEQDQSLLLTRLTAEQLAALPAEHRSRIDYDALSRTGVFGAAEPLGAYPRVAVVSAGSSDVAVAREAARTLNYYGETCREIHDVGIAGLWRLLDRLHEVRGLTVTIAVAGMDGALPAVLAGLVPGPVIAVPVSTGYGVAAGGYAALNTALASCAPGLVVVNIDNGYGAACAALRIVGAVKRAAGETCTIEGNDSR
ncbi:MAG: nickel pincer cofactor biosynthesis protein LarB [Gammaproteobacteria bacterium]